MGALPYPSTRRPPAATRIYHSHSRSRQLLALPLAAPLSSTDTRPSYKALARSANSNPLTPAKLIRISFLLAAGIVLFFFFEGLHRVPLSYVTIASSSHRLISGSNIPDPSIHQEQRIPRSVDSTFITTTSNNNDNKLNSQPPLQQQLQINSDEQVDTINTDKSQTNLQYVSSNIPIKQDQQHHVQEENDHYQKPVQVDHLPIIPHSDQKSTMIEIKQQDSVNTTDKFISTNTNITSPSTELSKNLSTVITEKDFKDPADFTTFTENTTLNYFHLHKTGGVSFKEKMYAFLGKKYNRHDKKINVRDTCHMSGPARPALGIEAEWSCDWLEVGQIPEDERNQIDVIVGHQYWEKGAGYLIPKRDLRYFTVMRHPLHRKVSFFYHFFVRNAGRKEDTVKADELIQFVLGNKMPDSPLVRDAGPGYYASRLWSDGLSGYDTHNTFVIPEVEANDLVKKSINRLRKNFVFIGLQTQEKASLCMLKQTMLEFSKAHGFKSMDRIDYLAEQKDRMNTGSYALTGNKLWALMTREQREEFKRIEKVDLAIYGESMKMFEEMAQRMKCDHLIDRSNEEDKIVYSN